MPKEDLQIEVDLSDLEGLKKDASAASNYALDRYTDNLLNVVKEEMPKKSGQMISKVGKWEQDNTTFAIGSDVFYRWWVHDGTGIYGETGQPITPVTAKFLRFEWHGEIIYTKSVRGQKPNPYYDRAIESEKDTISKYIGEALKKFM
jgi:hypothetical protein